MLAACAMLELIVCFFSLQDLLDVNTLELARQLTLAYTCILREIRVSYMDTGVIIWHAYI